MDSATVEAAFTSLSAMGVEYAGYAFAAVVLVSAPKIGIKLYRTFSGKVG